MKSLLHTVRTVSLLAVVAMLCGQSTAPSTPPTPPDAEHASEKLKSSPRHGEWVDVALKGNDVKLHSWVVYPERSGKAPVVVVIHEIFAMTDWVRGVADQLAAEGFLVIAPDLLSGMGPDGGGTESLGDKATDVIRKLSTEQTNARLDAAREFALKLPAASSKSGCVGFCWGGSASFAYAVHQPALNAAVVYYGTPPMKEKDPDKEALSHVACPVLGLYGADDAHVITTVEPTRALMKELSKPYTAHVFEKAGHGFLRQQNARDGANLKAAQQGWAETIAFFKKNVE
jgi:carboxymethylenebutenolidase